MEFCTEQELLEFGEFLGKILLYLPMPHVIELVGDVGVGKTTFTRGIAKGLGVKDSVTSPSFTISKSYACENNKTLVHYDFYRLNDPGIMKKDLEESITSEGTITVVEWGESVADILPKNHLTIHLAYSDDGSRSIDL